MGKKNMYHFCIAAALCLCFCGVAWAQSEFGGGVDVKSADPASKGPIRVESLPDGDQPASIPSNKVWTNKDLETPRKSSKVFKPLWIGFENMSPADKENAEIQLEPLHSLTPDVIQELRNIENLWNSGSYDTAILQLKNLEESGGVKLAAGIGWRKPKNPSGGDWFIDRQVNGRGGYHESCLCFDDTTGNLYDVLRRTTDAVDNTAWTVNVSTNNGATWNETYSWWTSGNTRDIGAAFAGRPYSTQVWMSWRCPSPATRINSTTGSIISPSWRMVRSPITGPRN
jgi:hypothetical protein